MANSVVSRAKRYAQNCGLYFPQLELPLKQLAVHDSSHATKDSVYAQEGVLILLMHDGQLEYVSSDSPLFKKVLNSKDQMNGFCHIIVFISHKAKRVSSSTSKAETLSAIHGKELAQLISVRLTEVLGHGILTPRGKQTPLSVVIQI